MLRVYLHSKGDVKGIQFKYCHFISLKVQKSCSNLVHSSLLSFNTGFLSKRSASEGSSAEKAENSLSSEVDFKASSIIDCACKCEVFIRLTIAFVCCEATALMDGCIKSMPECFICYDDLTPGGV